ncbi:MAG: threonine--tRNA ligase [Roseibium sp.]|uniref:threonine--tRNA ligase n=1 Tax=Roseibium sp. TaxID=1936156 RepID=UPI001B201057|nr:threonine--tRNA ligase [Roseibium sp.]MBO6891609.1 threonine--tRNA ligase [Roseibium sp.]MBO6931652.1 threonine--tRNA ligase [Roseibium sp.]
MVLITLPDGGQRTFEEPVTGSDIAASIAPSLKKKAIAMTLDGNLTDLSAPLTQDANVEFIMREDARALELIRHDAAHVLAEAVQELFPGTQATIGPVIENGFFYDFARDTPFTPDDLPVIEARMREIVARNQVFTREVWDREEAKSFFRDKGEHFKVELVDAIPEGEPIKIYRQGDWLDLCRGPHMTSTGKIGSAFKLTKVAGAYWRGDANNPMLTRIYGTAFATPEELDAHLKMLEEAEKRDHRRLGREMDLFHFQEEAPGSVFWHAKGWSLFQSLIAYMRDRQAAAGYTEVNTPDIMDRNLWETSGHWQNYREHMFTTKTEDDRDFALKPMNCPGHMLIYKQGLKSYRDMPLKIAEFGKVHRYEPSGALHGLLRVRSFTQDDAHIFCTEDQLTAECIKVNDLILSIYADFGFTDIRIKLSTRPEHRIGSDESWDRSEQSLRNALDTLGRPYSVNEGEGAFYGPKLEYVLRDAIGRDWQCGTLQVDFNLPDRFGTFYVDDKGQKVTPVMLHRAMFGSLERFTGILIEHHAGKLPLWLAPVQAVVTTITSKVDDYADEVTAALRARNIRVESDLRNEKIPYKVREHSLKKVPILVILGKNELESRTVSIRRLGSSQTNVLALEEALDLIAEEAQAPRSMTTTPLPSGSQGAPELMEEALSQTG